MFLKRREENNNIIYIRLIEVTEWAENSINYSLNIDKRITIVYY